MFALETYCIGRKAFQAAKETPLSISLRCIFKSDYKKQRKTVVWICGDSHEICVWENVTASNNRTFNREKNRVYFNHLEGESVNFCYVKQESFKTRRPVF